MKGIIGTGQVVGGGISMLTNRRPDYEIPESTRQALALAQAQYADPYMPGYERAEENIGLATSNAIRAAQEGGNARAGFQGAVAEAGAATRDLAARNEMAQQADSERLQRVLQVMAQAEDMEFQMDEFAPFADRQQMSADIIGAGLENYIGAAEDFGLGVESGLIEGMEMTPREKRLRELALGVSKSAVQSGGGLATMSSSAMSPDITIDAIGQMAKYIANRPR
jgi:hypothetical protein